MTAMLKVKARWHGFTGSPGYSNFFFREWSDGSWAPTTAEATAAAGKVRTFFDAVKGIFPPVVNIQVESDVEIIEDTNGSLVNVLTAATQTGVVGTNVNTGYSAPTGAVVNWLTGGVRNGRRVRGRTFLVPISAGAFETNGSLGNSWITTIQTAGNAMMAADPAAPDFGVYSRPSVKGATDGAFQIATGTRVPDMAAVLRSRRD